MGIQYNDNFRYKIIHEDFGTNQDTSLTSDVIEYYIKAKNGRLYQIIDTPGFGDTAGIKKDMEITNKITDFFLYRINTINAVCLVTKSPENRLSATQSYIFDCIFDLFGEDTKKLFIAMLTFSDGGEANALSFLQSDKCLFSKMIECDNQEWYFKFNNSAILKRNKKDQLNLTFWNIGMKSFERFTEKLNKFSPVKLDQTQQVLRERSRLSQNIEILNGKLKLALNKTEAIKQQYKVINGLKIDINDSKNYEIETQVPEVKKVPFSESGRYMTTCLICTRTCHVKCYIKDDDDKRRCTCIDNNGYCTVCPKKCLWTEHKNRPYQLVDCMKIVKTTLNDLKKNMLTAEVN